MMEDTKMVGADAIFDDKSLKMLKTLLENPKISYNKSQLATQAEISRQSLYRRWDTFEEQSIVIDSSAPGESSFYQLNTESELVNNLGKILTALGEYPEE